MASSTPVDKSPATEGASGTFSVFHFPFSDVAGISQVCPTIPHAQPAPILHVDVVGADIIEQTRENKNFD